MAKKKNAAVEGEEHASAPVEEIVVEEAAPVEAITPDEAPPEEESTEEVPEETIDPHADVDVTKIKYLLKGPIANADGGLIYQDQIGDVPSHLADALVGRGQAEYIE